MEGAMGKVIVVVETQNVADLLDAGEQLTVVEGGQEERDTVQEQEQGQVQEQEQEQGQEQGQEQDHGVSQASTVEEWHTVVGDQPEENDIVP
jgi:hypothetical protein